MPTKHAALLKKRRSSDFVSCEKVDELQQILYAEHQRSLLLRFQAMDTGGQETRVQRRVIQRRTNPTCEALLQ